MNPAAHLTDDQLIERLYGVSDDSHFDACPECQGRAQALDHTRAQFVAQSTPPAAYFHRQRRSILARIGEPVRKQVFGSIWVPASLAVVLSMGLVITRLALPEPGREAATAAMHEGEEMIEILQPGWFEETYSVMRIPEPQAASPIRGLFTEAPRSE